MSPVLGFFYNLGAPEMIVIGAVALIFFGRRLPEVGRSLGKGIVEFKKGLKGIQDDIDLADQAPSSPSSTDSDDQPKPQA